MGCPGHQGRTVGNGTSPVGRIGHPQVLPCRDPLQGSFLQGNAYPVAALGHRAEHISRAVQLPVLQAGRQLRQTFLRRLPHGIQVGHQTGEAGPGHTGISKGDFSPKSVGQQIGPAGEPSWVNQLGIIDQHHRKGRKRRPKVLPRTVSLWNLCFFRTGVGLQTVGIGLQTLHAAAKHHIGPRSLPLLPDLLQKLAAAAGDHIHPDSRALLKLLDDGPPHFLFVGGIDNQALLLRRHI